MKVEITFGRVRVRTPHPGGARSNQTGVTQLIWFNEER